MGYVAECRSCENTWDTGKIRSPYGTKKYHVNCPECGALVIFTLEMQRE